jgi:hypothetical protein
MTVIQHQVLAVGFDKEIQIVVTEKANDTLNAVVTFGAKVKRKTFRGETAHHSAQRWVNDLTLPVIHGAKDSI